MRIAKLGRVGGSREIVTAFLGLNRENTAKDSTGMEMQDEKGLSTRAYPHLACMTPYKLFKQLNDETNTFTIIDKDTHPLFIYSDFHSGNIVRVLDMQTNTEISNHSVTGDIKTFVKMGARVIIHPDMIEYDSVSNQWTSLSHTEEYGSNRYMFVSACDKEGTFYKTYPITNAPHGQMDNTYVVDADNNSVYVWKDTKWEKTEEYYLKLRCEVADFRKNQRVSAEGAEDSGIVIPDGVVVDRTDELYEEQGNTRSVPNLIVKGYLTFQQESGEFTVVSPISLTSSTPKMDYICASGNRLWGCRYGDDLNEIYASALGDASVWGLFEDTSMDSYIASIGEDGKWTGCIEYNGHPMFFKENMIYTIYGMYPAQYQISKQEGLGMKDNGAACVFNNVLYYGSHEGVCAYTGSVPRVISQDCGVIDLRAIAGAGHILYAVDGKEGYVYTYDTDYRLWHCEGDQYGAVYYAYAYKDLVYFNADGDIMTTEIGHGEVDWYAITPKLNLKTPDSSYLAEIQIRTEFMGSASLKVYVSYDEGSYDGGHDVTSGGNTWRDVSRYTWSDVASMTWQELQANKNGVFPYVVHLRLKRASTCRIKLVGTGDVRIITLTKHWRNGSDSTWR